MLVLSDPFDSPRTNSATGLPVVGNTLGRTQGRAQNRSWAEAATLSYEGRNWDARNGKFEIGFEGYKERNPAKE